MLVDFLDVLMSNLARIFFNGDILLNLFIRGLPMLLVVHIYRFETSHTKIKALVYTLMFSWLGLALCYWVDFRREQ